MAQEDVLRTISERLGRIDERTKMHENQLGRVETGVADLSTRMTIQEQRAFSQAEAGADQKAQDDDRDRWKQARMGAYITLAAVLVNHLLDHLQHLVAGLWK